MISLEEVSVYLCIKRWLLWDSRQQTLQEIKRIIDDATDKCYSMINSKFMTADSICEEHKVLMDNLKTLHAALVEALPGIDNLRITYCQDFSTIAQIDLMLSKVHGLIQRLSAYA